MRLSGRQGVRSVFAVVLVLAATLLLAAPVLAGTATSSDGLTGTASATYTVNPSTEDPRCQRLRDKLKRQKRGLAKAKTPRKRAFIQHNIGQTNTRLRVFNCAAG